jgi:lipoic acid synthetase
MSIQTITTDSRPRHPEKAQKPDNPIQRRPAWIRVKAPTLAIYHETLKIIRKNNLRTVCEEATCANIGEYWSVKSHPIMTPPGYSVSHC